MITGAIFFRHIKNCFDKAVGHPQSHDGQCKPQPSHKHQMPCIPNPFEIKWKHCYPPLNLCKLLHTSYETTPKWHSFFFDQTCRFSDQQLAPSCDRCDPTNYASAGSSSPSMTSDDSSISGDAASSTAVSIGFNSRSWGNIDR